MYAFEYDAAWARSDVQLAPELMANSSRIYVFPTLNVATYCGLPPMIADALPDAFGNAIVDAWLARNGIAKDRVTALDRLAYLGDRGMGALEFLPDRQPRLPAPTALDISELVLSARRAVEGSLADEDELRDSAAGLYKQLVLRNGAPNRPSTQNENLSLGCKECIIISISLS